MGHGMLKRSLDLDKASEMAGQVGYRRVEGLCLRGLDSLLRGWGTVYLTVYLQAAHFTNRTYARRRRFGVMV